MLARGNLGLLRYYPMQSLHQPQCRGICKWIFKAVPQGIVLLDTWPSSPDLCLMYYVWTCSTPPAVSSHESLPDVVLEHQSITMLSQ